MRGHIRQQGKTWYAIVNLGRDASTGKRKQKWHRFSSRREAQAGLTEILSRLDRGTYVEQTKVTVAQFLDEWFTATSATRRASTNATYRSVISAHLVPNIGEMRLQALMPATLNALYSTLLSTGKSGATVRYVHAVMRKALGDAQRWNMVARNAADAADPPRVARRQITTWSAREVRSFLAHVAPDRLCAAYVLSATTGMRRGEVLGLRWRDVDLDAGRVSIAQTLVSIAGAAYMSEPKTTRGRRMIALDATTTNALTRHRAAQMFERATAGRYVDHDLVFVQEDGSPLSPAAFSDAFWHHVKAAKLPRIRLHDLRHTHATLALAAGVHPKVVSERLGHASVAFTLDTYSHAIPSMQETAAELVALHVFGEETEAA
jgi:integrase